MEEFGGVGLGLSIARWVAKAHGGSIEVQSSRGSWFCIGSAIASASHLAKV